MVYKTAREMKAEEPYQELLARFGITFTDLVGGRLQEFEPSLRSDLYGGHFLIGESEDREKLLKRLLTPTARTKRVAIIDNAKGKLSNADIESLITAQTISGYANYIGESERTKSQLLDFVQPSLANAAEDFCLGNISELFDGDPPHAARGCPAQARSVAETLRVLWEENLVV